MKRIWLRIRHLNTTFLYLPSRTGMTIGGWANQATGTPDSSQGLDVLKGKPRFTRPFFGRENSNASHHTNKTHAGPYSWVWRKRVGVESNVCQNLKELQVIGTPPKQREGMHGHGYCPRIAHAFCSCTSPLWQHHLNHSAIRIA